MAEPQGVKIYHFRHENCGNAFRAALVLPLLDCVLIMAEGIEQTSYNKNLILVSVAIKMIADSIYSYFRVPEVRIHWLEQHTEFIGQHVGSWRIVSCSALWKPIKTL